MQQMDEDVEILPAEALEMPTRRDDEDQLATKISKINLAENGSMVDHN